jgi:hypothetical protein
MAIIGNMQEEPEHIRPTPERYKHSGVEILDRAIADDEGRPSQPYRSIDILQLLERRGVITHGMWLAGDRFRTSFRRAQLDPLKAADMARPVISGGKPQLPMTSTENARESVWRAILAVGGLNSAGGSCIWHVIGWERTLKEWALEQGWNGRRVSQDAARGILIASLGTLEAHYERG